MSTYSKLVRERDTQPSEASARGLRIMHQSLRREEERAIRLIAYGTGISPILLHEAQRALPRRFPVRIWVVEKRHIAVINVRRPTLPRRLAVCIYALNSN